MSVSSISPEGPFALSPEAMVASPELKTPVMERGGGFPQLLMRLENGLSEPYQVLAGYEARLKSGQKLSVQELIHFQVQAGHFGVGVELLSKLAESMIAATRRLQQGQ